MGIEQFIDNEVKANDVVLFMKGTPQFPMCGFSGQLVQILDYLGVPYKGLNVLESDDLRSGIKSYSNWPTIPQLYVKGEFVGGCDIVREMFQAGKLQWLLKDKGISVKENTAEWAASPFHRTRRARLPHPICEQYDQRQDQCQADQALGGHGRRKFQYVICNTRNKNTRRV